MGVIDESLTCKGGAKIWHTCHLTYTSHIHTITHVHYHTYTSHIHITHTHHHTYTPSHVHTITHKHHHTYTPQMYSCPMLMSCLQDLADNMIDIELMHMGSTFDISKFYQVTVARCTQCHYLIQTYMVSLPHASIYGVITNTNMYVVSLPNTNIYGVIT